MKKFILALSLLVVVIAPLLAVTPVHAAPFDPNHLIDDGIFENINSMTAAQIDAWINISFPGSCISSNNSFVTPDPLGWSPSQNKYLFGGNVTAGQAIHDTAVLYQINPQVILATMQKEQSLVSGGAGCYPNLPDPATATPMTNQCGKGTRNCTLACTHSGGCMNIALGYGCPGYCDAKDEGFSMQLTLGTWLLRFGEQRALGHLTGYVGYESGDENFQYDGPMTPGMRQRSASLPATLFDGSYTTAANESITITTGATAALYNFTPFISGNKSFVNTFQGWFGSTVLGCGPSETMMPQVSSLYNRATYDHFYTPYQCEINVLTYEQGYRNEGYVYNVTPPTTPNAVPVYRLYNPINARHIWTTNLPEAVNLTHNHFVQEGVAYYTSPTTSTIPNYPVFRLFLPSTGDHIWTQSFAAAQSAANNAGYNFEGPAFYSQ